MQQDEGAKPIYNEKPTGTLTRQQEENRAKAIMTQAQIREKVMRGFDLGQMATSGSYEVPE